MTKLDRFACILTPFLLTLASLTCLILVGLGGSSPSNHTLSNLYFFRANTSAVHLNTTALSPLDLLSLLSSNLSAFIDTDTGIFDATQAFNLSDWYTVYLWNYCEGNTTAANDTASEVVPTNCSRRERMFWFDAVAVWGLNDTAGGVNTSDPVWSEALDTYHTASKWMFVTYCIAVVATGVELVVGMTALLSRLGSFATTVVSVVSSVSVLGFGVAATVIYATLLGALDVVWKRYNVQASLGKTMLATVWLAVGFSWAAGLFWLFSVCCCSGRSGLTARRRGGMDDEVPRMQIGTQIGTQVVYQRVEGEGMGMGMQAGKQAQAVAMKDMGRREEGTAYEPFRY